MSHQKAEEVRGRGKGPLLCACVLCACVLCAYITRRNTY